MTTRLRFPTLFDALPPTAVTARPAAATVPYWRIRRALAVIAGLVVGLAALTGCGHPAPNVLLDADAERARPAEAVVQPVSERGAAPAVHEPVTPGAGALRLPSSLQGHGV